jgi:hypothetical protein
MSIIGEEIRSLLDEIAESNSVPYLDTERELTIQMLAERMSISMKRAQVILDKRVADGLLERVYRVNPENHHKMIAYRKPE